MNKFALSVCLIGIFGAGSAEADQWDDILQSVAQQSAARGEPIPNALAVNAAVQAMNCPGGDPGVSSNFSAIGCVYGNSVRLLTLKEFARQGDLTNAQAQIAQWNQALQNQSIDANRGVAMAIAMGGNTEPQPGETVSFAANWGTFNGQNAFSGGIAYRIADHVAVNGGVAAAPSGGAVAGRAGFRFGW